MTSYGPSSQWVLSPSLSLDLCVGTGQGMAHTCKVSSWQPQGHVSPTSVTCQLHALRLTSSSPHDPCFPHLHMKDKWRSLLAVEPMTCELSLPLEACSQCCYRNHSFSPLALPSLPLASGTGPTGGRTQWVTKTYFFVLLFSIPTG